MKVAVIGHTAALGGAELVLLRLLEQVDRALFDPVVILFADGPLVARLRDAGQTVVVVPLSDAVADAHRDQLASGLIALLTAARTSVMFIVRLRKLLRQLEVEVVHTNTLKAHLLAGVAARSLRLPLVCYVHDRISSDYLPAPVARAMRLVLRYLPTHTLVNSLATKATLAPMPANRWTLAYPGVDSTVIAIDPSHPVAGQPGIGQPVIGILGRISPTKGQQIFVRAAAAVRTTIPDVRFVIAGSALFGEQAYDQRLRSLVSELGLTDSVQFRGFITDVPALMAELNVLVHASPVPEPFGQVVVEAMMAAVPVIATRAGGVPEIVLDGDEPLGILVPPNDVRELSEAMVEVITGGREVRLRAERAQQSARRRFSVEQMVAAVSSGWRAAAAR